MKLDTSSSKIKDYFSDETQYVKFPFSFIIDTFYQQHNSQKGLFLKTFMQNP